LSLPAPLTGLARAGYAVSLDGLAVTLRATGQVVARREREHDAAGWRALE
jgi:hypothetical protein